MFEHVDVQHGGGVVTGCQWKWKAFFEGVIRMHAETVRHPNVLYSLNEKLSWRDFTFIRKVDKAIQKHKDRVLSNECYLLFCWLPGELLWHFATPQQQEAPFCDCLSDCVRRKISDMTDRELAG